MQKTELRSFGSTLVVTFPHLPVKHGCSTRVGGVSASPFHTLNTGFTVSDDPVAVWENRRRFAACLEQEWLPSILSMTHGKEVARIDSAVPVPADRTRAPRPPYSADACITNRAGVPLSLTIADCVPVFFFDPKAGCIGLAHAGWRGTVSGIVKETVEALRAAYGSRPGDLLVGIGPSIGPQQFEVGSEVACEFAKEFPEHPELISPMPESGKARVDLWLANRYMARRAGVPDENIVDSGWCTASHPEYFFSHRRDRGHTGRLLAGIVL